MLNSFFKEKFLLNVCGVLGVVGVLSGDELRLFAALESASIAWMSTRIVISSENRSYKLFQYALEISLK